MAYTIETLVTFEGQGQGWSEIFYWLSTDGNLLNAQAIITPILQARAKLLANSYVLTVARNSQVLNNANQKVLRVTDLMEPRYPGTAAWNPATPNLALMCYWQNPTNTASKKQYMRGIPEMLGQNGKAPFTGWGNWQSYWNQWTSKMLSLPAGWLSQQVTQNLVITNYVVDPVTAQVTFTLSLPTGFTWPVTPGNPIAVYVKLPGKNPLDGRLVVIVSDTPTIVFTPGSHPTAPLPTGQIGTMQLKSPVFVPVSGSGQGAVLGQIDPQRIVSHKTGRPIYASRGRAPVKAKW